MSINSNIEEYIKDIGQRIGRILVIDNDGEAEFTTIEKEIYEVAICYAKIFLFETQSFLLEEGTEKRLKFSVQTRFNVNQKELEKMSNIDLVAHCIKLEVIETIEKAGFVIS